MSKYPHVLIVGAGIGGLTAARALLLRGVDVDVFEQSPELKEIGAGLHLSPNGSRVLRSLGLGDALDRVAVNQTDREVCLWNTGQGWKLPNHGANATAQYGAPYLLMHRGDLHALLLEGVRQLKPDSVHAAARCVDATQAGEKVQLRFEDGATVSGDACIGADGFHSCVRAKLFGEQDPKFTGYIAWRGLVPIERVPSRIPHYSAAWMGPNGQVTLYPVRRGELLNFVGVIARDNWRVESWTVEGTHEECLVDFVGWHAAIRELIQNMTIPYKWALFARQSLPSWTVDRITLLGDAAHAMLPFLGQGANAAVEDGEVLARCLAGSGADLPTALDRYENARRPRTTRIIQESIEQWRRVRNPVIADPIEAPRYVEREWAVDKVKSRYDWIFEYDAATVAL